jgi:cell wall-associated NlpC family hydrolase
MGTNGLLLKSLMRQARFLVLTAAWLIIAGDGPAAARSAAAPQPWQKVMAQAEEWLAKHAVSYAWGGSQIGSAKECQACNACLDAKSPAPKTQLADCPECRLCSLDCSHFISLVYRDAGYRAPYLTTTMMRSLAPRVLRERYGWVTLGARPERALPGDLLVYDGHVVMVVKVSRPGHGNVVHVTSGKEVRGPGQGIQKQRRVDFRDFRGPVLRVLRHVDLNKARIQTLRDQRRVRRIDPG